MDGNRGMGQHLKLGKPLSIQVFGEGGSGMKFEDLDEVGCRFPPAPSTACTSISTMLSSICTLPSSCDAAMAQCATLVGMTRVCCRRKRCGLPRNIPAMTAWAHPHVLASCICIDNAKDLNRSACSWRQRTLLWTEAGDRIGSCCSGSAHFAERLLAKDMDPHPRRFQTLLETSPSTVLEVSYVV